MAFQPQGTSGNGRINAGFFPPCRFIATAVNLPMMATAQGNSELIADLAAKRPWLRKSQMMSIRRAAAADETRLLGNQLNVIPVANPARIVPEKWTQVRSRSRKARILAPDYYDLTPQSLSSP